MQPTASTTDAARPHAPSRLAILAPGSAFLAIGGLLFPSSGTEDAYLTYWPAYTLASVGKIQNTNGDAIEQSSSLLQVMLLGVAHRASAIDLDLLAHLLSILAGLATVLLCARLAEGMRRGTGLAAGLLLALNPYLTYWSFSGMETSLTALFTLLLFAALVRSSGAAGGASRTGAGVRSLLLVVAAGALFVTVRPEMPVVGVCALLAGGVLALVSMVTSRPGERGEARGTLRAALVGLVALGILSAGLAAWRLWAFGSPVPQPATAKTGVITTVTLLRGSAYVLNMYGITALALVAIGGGVGFVAGLLRGDESAARTWLVALLAANTAFILTVGGDWMEAGRFAVPALPLLVLFCVATLYRQLPIVAARAGVVVLAIASVAAVFVCARTESNSLPLWVRSGAAAVEGAGKYGFFERTNRLQLRDIPTARALDDLVTQIQRARPGRLWLLTGQGGLALHYTLMRHQDHLGVIDRRGIMDRYLTRSPTARRHGREKYGLAIRHVGFLDEFVRIHRETGVPEPDIIFDLRFLSHEHARLEEHGYVMVYEQGGTLASGSPWLPGRRIWARQTIFLRRELLKHLDASFPREVHF